MTKLGEFMAGEWLRGTDLPANGTDVWLTIKSVDVVEQKDGSRQLVLQFYEDDRRLGCNKTNVARMAQATGLGNDDDSNALIGRRIAVYQDIANNPSTGQPGPCVRIRHYGPPTDIPATQAPEAAPAQGPAQAPPPTAQAKDAHTLYGKLYNEAKQAGVPGLEKFRLDPSMPKETIIELGEALRAALNAHNQDDLPF